MNTGAKIKMVCRRSDSTAFPSLSDVYSLSRNFATFPQPQSAYITSTELTTVPEDGTNLALKQCAGRTVERSTR